MGSVKKKIAIVITNPDFSFKNRNSAVANFLFLIGESLEKSGYYVEYFPKSDASAYGVSKGLSFRNSLKKVAKFFAPALFFNKKFDIYFNRVNSLSHQMVEQTKGFDLLVEFCVFGAATGYDSKRNSKIRYVLIFDAPLEIQFAEMYGKTGKFGSLIRDAEEKSLRNAEAVICYSEPVKKYLKDEFSGLSAIETIPCIAWKKEIPKREVNGVVNIGFIGSFLNWHKVELLVKAFESVAAKNSEVHLILVGYGEEWNNIRALVDKSPVSSRINMTGFVDESRLEEIKSEMAIGVMPGSNWYGSPLKIFEYAESGIAVIAPETPTVTQYFKHDENALIIDSDNPLASLTQNLESLIYHPEVRERLGKAALKMMQNDLSKENVLSKFVQLIEKTI